MSQRAVLHVIDTTGPGGAEVVFVELVDRLRQEGYRSVPVVRGPGWVFEALRRRGFEPVVVPAKGSFNLRYLLSLIRLIRSERISLIHAHLLGSSVYCALAGIVTRRPVIATFHGMVDVAHREKFLIIKRSVLQAGATWVVAVSRALSEALSNGIIPESQKITVIHNGIDTASFARRPTGWLHKSLNIPTQSVLAISVGNVRPAKDYTNLCRTAALLKGRHPDLHFVIAGDTNHALTHELQSLCKNLKIEDRIHFIGFQGDPAIVLAEGNLFVLSSSSEGFSLSTIEALAAGLPVVVTACGGPEGIVTAGEDALVVPLRDPDALAEAISAIVSQPELRERLSVAGIRRCREHFDIDSTISKYKKLYDISTRTLQEISTD